MWFWRLIGFLFLLVAAITLLRDLVAWYDSGSLQILSGAELWLVFGTASYYTAQDWVMNYSPMAWDPVITTILNLPAFLTALVIGLLLLVASSRRGKPRRRRTPVRRPPRRRSRPAPQTWGY